MTYEDNKLCVTDTDSKLGIVKCVIFFSLFMVSFFMLTRFILM